MLTSLTNRFESDTKSIDVNADDIMFRTAKDLIYSCFYKKYNHVNYNPQDKGNLHKIRGMHGYSHWIVPYIMLYPLVMRILKPFVGNLFGHKKIVTFIKEQLASSLVARKEKSLAEKKGVKIDTENIPLGDGRVYRRNMIDPFTDSYYEGKISRTEYMNSSLFLFFAGVKTVADAMSRMLYYLATNTTAQEKLRESIFTSGIDSEYLTWCINEVLRLEPPVTNSCGRITEYDIEVKEGVVPKGTYIITHAYTIHRLPEYWGEDANQFNPDRWRDADKFHPTQFIPFGLGPRSCVGKEFALCSIRKVMVSLLTRYKFERCERTSDANLFRAFVHMFLIIEFPTYVRITKLNA